MPEKESEKNLMAAFAGESQANRKYLAFADKAEKDGLPQIAKVFRAAAMAETIHAHNHFRAVGGIKSTEENVKAAIEGEHYEFSKMYPEFLKKAIEEGNKTAERTFKFANEVEKVHHKLYTDALEAAKSGKDLPEGDMYVCPVCGHTVWGKPEEDCPVCKAKKEKYLKVEAVNR